jgi:CRISPR/Cas system-associated exonuclease Cas4 (RecB family)
MQLPIILSKDEAFENFKFERLSPSSLYRVREKCAFQSILAKCFKDSPGLLLPQPYSAIWGTISHSLCEYAANKTDASIKDLIDKCNELVQIQECKLANEYPILKNISLSDNVRRNAAIIAANNILSKKAMQSPKDANCKSYVEQYFKYDDLHLGGYIDRVLVKNNKAIIIDYKFGEIFNENGEIKEEYLLQLRLYAMMYENTHKEDRVENLVLITQDGERHEVELEREKWMDIQNSTKELFNRIDGFVKRKEWDKLAKPEDETCKYCNCKHFCQFASLKEEDMFCIKRGVLNEVKCGNVMSLTTAENQRFDVYGLNSYNIDHIDEYIGKQIVFANITSLDDTQTSYRLNSKSLIYENRW